MTEKTAEIERLDYDQPPRTYIVERIFESNMSALRREVALDAAWAHYKAHNDPPGMSTADDALFGWCFVIETRHYTWPREGSRPLREHHEAGTGAAARAAAWAWHDRRLVLAARLEAAWSDAMEPGKERTSERERALAGHRRGQLWPSILSWPDDQVALHERWLVDSTAELPEVLGG